MDELKRRDALKLLAAAAATATAGTAAANCTPEPARATTPGSSARSTAIADAREAVVSVSALGFPWTTVDPFIACMHHDDAYPAGNGDLGPAATLEGRRLGYDFEGRDGWRMYHGRRVPGFPQHPHRGFETVTVVRRGLLDHSDSMGATARYGGGDTQWLTAGSGILHAEMFPLVDANGPNPLELFQIWLNLPSERKMVQPYFAMLWDQTIPRHHARDDAGRTTEVTLVAGRLGDLRAPSPPPNSYASRADSDVAIWTLRMEPGARWTLPAASRGTNRNLYFFRGRDIRVGGRTVAANQRVELHGDASIALENGNEPGELLLLQGRPIGEPVITHGPFVMNTRDEIRQAILDYQRTQFGGWPWGSDDPVHPREAGRFARRPDGSIDRPSRG